MLKTLCVCDRCGAEAPAVMMDGVETYPHGWSEGKPDGLDLCPECIREVIRPTHMLYEAVGYTTGGERYAHTGRSMQGALQRLMEEGRGLDIIHVLIKRMPLSDLRQGREGRCYP